MDHKAYNREFVASMLGAGSLKSVVDNARVMSEGREQRLYLHGARRVPLLSVLSRPFRQLYSALAGDGGLDLVGGAESGGPGGAGSSGASAAVDPRVLDGRVAFGLAIQEVLPSKFTFVPVGEAQVEALGNLSVVVDGDEFFLAPPDGSGTMIRAFGGYAIDRSQDALNAMASALGVTRSSWADYGVREVVAAVNPDSDQWDYEVRTMARWGARSLPGIGRMAVECVGCERVLMRLVVIPAGAGPQQGVPVGGRIERADEYGAHAEAGESKESLVVALRRQAEAAGVVESGEMLILLVVTPDISDTPFVNAGPASNNVLSDNAERVWDGSVSPLTHDCQIVALRLLDAYVEEGGNILDIAPTLEGAFALLVMGLENLTAQMMSGVVHRQHAEHVAQWVMGHLAVNDPDNGGKIVAAISKLRDEGRDIALSGSITPEGNFRVTVNEVDPKGSPLSEKVLIPG